MDAQTEEKRERRKERQTVKWKGRHFRDKETDRDRETDRVNQCPVSAQYPDETRL